MMIFERVFMITWNWIHNKGLSTKPRQGDLFPRVLFWTHSPIVLSKQDGNISYQMVSCQLN